MLSAYVSFIKGKEDALVVPMASDRTLQFDPYLATFTAPVSALEPVRLTQLPDELVDSLAEEDHDEGEIETDALQESDDENDTEAFA